VKNFHAVTLQALGELVAAAGLDHPNQFMPAHFSRRVSARDVVNYDELYPTLRPGELINGDYQDLDGEIGALGKARYRLGDYGTFVQY
jgi:hypothetical protein